MNRKAKILLPAVLLIGLISGTTGFAQTSLESRLNALDPIINSAIAAYYYLRIIVYMYMRDERPVEAPVASIPFSLAAGLVISLIAVIYLGVLPNHVLDYAIRGAQDLLK